MAKKYVEQFERTKRLHQRFQQLTVGIEHTQASPNYDDDMYSFFQNCYHLKDWIKNDPYCDVWPDVEEFINANQDLKICADLCNGLKHLSLTRPRSSESPQFAGGKIALNISEGISEKASVSIAVSYEIATTNRGILDAFVLASSCVSAWTQFIAANDP